MSNVNINILADSVFPKKVLQKLYQILFKPHSNYRQSMVQENFDMIS